MRFFLIAAITIIIIFSLNPLFRRVNKAADKKAPSRIHIHHSVPGVFLIIVGVIAESEIVAAIGLGVYMGHALEEIYFNKTRFPKAFFIFVTR